MIASLDPGSNFSQLDWIIIAVYLLATVVIGLDANRDIRSMADYVGAGRSGVGGFRSR